MGVSGGQGHPPTPADYCIDPGTITPGQFSRRMGPQRAGKCQEMPGSWTGYDQRNKVGNSIGVFSRTW